MRTVWKLKLETIDGWQKFGVPNFRNVLHVGLQDGNICAWVERDDYWANNDHSVELMITGTGHEVPKLCAHVGSVIQPPFVWHVWQNNEK
jgi:hypothetical protein